MASMTVLSATGAPMRAPARIDPMILVRDASGVPQPPSDVLRRLAQWEPNLGLKYHAVQWAFTWTWPESDPRRARIQAGDYPADAAYDVIGYIPLDCAVDEIPAYAATALKCYPRDDVRKLVDSIGRYNAVDVGIEQTKQIVDMTLGSQAFAADVTPGISTAVAIDLAPPKETRAQTRAQRRARLRAPTPPKP